MLKFLFSKGACDHIFPICLHIVFPAFVLEPLHSHLLIHLFLSKGLCHQNFKLLHVYKKLIMQ